MNHDPPSRFALRRASAHPPYVPYRRQVEIRGGHGISGKMLNKSPSGRGGSRRPSRGAMRGARRCRGGGDEGLGVGVFTRGSPPGTRATGVSGGGVPNGVRGGVRGRRRSLRIDPECRSPTRVCHPRHRRRGRRYSQAAVLLSRAACEPGSRKEAYAITRCGQKDEGAQDQRKEQRQEGYGSEQVGERALAHRIETGQIERRSRGEHGWRPRPQDEWLEQGQPQEQRWRTRFERAQREHDAIPARRRDPIEHA